MIKMKCRKENSLATGFENLELRFRRRTEMDKERELRGSREAALDGDGLRLPRIFAEGMVLQRSRRTRIWGWSHKMKSVEATLHDGSRILAYAEAKPDESGYWEVLLDLQEAGSGYLLEIRTDSGDVRKIENVAVGEVWLCSGQSNMELPIRRIPGRFPEEDRNRAGEQLRIFQIGGKYTF